tara:strand:- start:1600 stop:1725 length:126 start_codon:yes stop_codon:yes gene_type:complete
MTLPVNLLCDKSLDIYEKTFIYERKNTSTMSITLTMKVLAA